MGRTAYWFNAGPPGRYRIGILSLKAWAMPPIEFSDPGPPCVIVTPNFWRLFNRLNPSAAIRAPRSWRNIIVRIPSFATASIKLLEGKQEIHSTPSNFSILATASRTFINLPPVLSCRSGNRFTMIYVSNILNVAGL